MQINANIMGHGNMMGMLGIMNWNKTTNIPRPFVCTHKNGGLPKPLLLFLGVYGGYRYTGIIMGNGNIIDFSFAIME